MGGDNVPLMITEETSIDYDIHGQGPPLLLIGGLGFGRWGFFKQIPALSRHFRTITFDVRGERRLEDGVGDLVTDVVALLDHLGVRKAHVLGTSLGGFVAQELALVRPDLVDRLVLVCTSYGGIGPESMSPQALADMLGWGSFSPDGVVGRASRRRPLRPTAPSTPRSSSRSFAGASRMRPRTLPTMSRPGPAPASMSPGTLGT
jgi:pimeloyl-ACP methyl ester carboxylesterase